MTLTYPGIEVRFDDGGTLHSVKFQQFSDTQPRAYVDAADVGFSSAGAIAQSGATRTARKVWTIVSRVSSEDAFALEALFEAYDGLRATGASAVVSVIDETRRPPGAGPIVATAVFSAQPTFEGGTNGTPTFLVSLALIEV